MYYTRPEEILKAFVELFQTQKELLGLAYVATQDENLIPEYPAIQISMGNVNREDHGTRQFLVTFEAAFWVYHANFESTRATRNIEDMELATNVVRFLHLTPNRALNNGTEDKLIVGSGRVTQEQPGIIVGAQGNRIVTTRLAWAGQSVIRYVDS